MVRDWRISALALENSKVLIDANANHPAGVIIYSCSALLVSDRYYHK